MAVSDFVLLHNKAAEALARSDRVGFDFYSGMADLKALFLKYCKPFEKRLRSIVPAGDGEAPTTVSIPGFLVDARVKSKKTFAPMKVEMQFIENHKSLYLERHRDFSKVDYAPQSEASLQNIQTLIILEIGLLMGCDIDWGTAHPESAADEYRRGRSPGS